MESSSIHVHTNISTGKFAVGGNWPAFIYIPVRKLDSIPAICLGHFRGQYNLTPENIEIQDEELHISLSKPFDLRHHQIKSFVDQLSNEISSVFKRRFCLEVYREYCILNNCSSTRSFVCLPTEDRSGILQELVEVVNSVLKNYQQEEYHKKPKFHVTVGSLPYRDVYASDVIVEVPRETVAPAESALTGDLVDIHRFTRRFDYSDSDDDDSNSGKNEAADKMPISEIDTIRSEVTKELLSCSVIECVIGHRLFRFDTSSDTAVRFVEVIEKESVNLGVPSKKRKL